ncbi:MAG: S8 family serine peptidase [Candidatus Moranbacteria bacterium]|nr:S8 family serine peptidase [Candidatus Moranbacteria bacterium]
MKKIWCLFFFCICIFNLSNAAPKKTLAEEKHKKISKIEEKKDYVEGEIIVKFKKKSIDFKKHTKEEIIKKSLEKLKEQDEGIRQHNIQDVEKKINAILIKSSEKNEELIEKYKKIKDVKIVEPNYKKSLLLDSNDPYFTGENQWYLQNISATEAWNVEEVGASEVIVAVMDTGVKYNHPDLANNLWNGTSCQDEDNNPSSCPNHGWDYYDSDDNPTYSSYHGTMVAGIIAAETNNSSGISGISYHNKLKIMALRVGNDYISTWATIQAISFANNNNAQIINASYGGEGHSQIEKEAIDSFDGIFVAAAGNEANNNDNNPIYPCSYNSSNIICVAATNQDNDLAYFSNYGSTNVDVAAPGVGITSTCYDSDYCTSSGTSFATPIVVGAAGSILANNPTLNKSDLLQYTINSGDILESLANSSKTEKKLNLNNALNLSLTATENLNRYPVYRFANYYTGAYLYTSKEREKNYIVNDLSDTWRYEGVSYYTSLSQ